MAAATQTQEVAMAAATPDPDAFNQLGNVYEQMKENVDHLKAKIEQTETRKKKIMNKISHTVTGTNVCPSVSQKDSSRPTSTERPSRLSKQVITACSRAVPFCLGRSTSSIIGH